MKEDPYPVKIYDSLDNELCRRINTTYLYYCVIVDLVRHPEKYLEVPFDEADFVKSQLKTLVKVTSAPSTEGEVEVKFLRYVS